MDCLAYIDLNPLRAGLIERPEEYCWNSLGYDLQTDNKDNFLSLDFSLQELGEFVGPAFYNCKAMNLLHMLV